MNKIALRSATSGSLLEMARKEEGIGTVRLERWLGFRRSPNLYPLPMSSPLSASERSTHAPLVVEIVIEGGAETKTCDGETIVVNRHAAQIATSIGLRVGMRISIHVYVTDKRASARVVHINPENPLHCGIELEEPQNIWGVALPPSDWEEKRASERNESNETGLTTTEKKDARCPYCVVGDTFPL